MKITAMLTNNGLLPLEEVTFVMAAPSGWTASASPSRR